MTMMIPRAALALPLALTLSACGELKCDDPQALSILRYSDVAKKDIFEISNITEVGRNKETGNPQCTALVKWPWLGQKNEGTLHYIVGKDSNGQVVVIR